MTSKITIISYIGTYYAIGAAWILTVANYFAIGWFNGYLDQYYIDSWKVWFSIVIVFNGLGNVALATMRYRIGERSWFGSLIENFKWTLMFAIFLGGLSLHVSQALYVSPAPYLCFEKAQTLIHALQTLPHVRDQHDLGRHLQRGRSDQLLQGSAPCAQVLQVQHGRRAFRHHHDGHTCRRLLHPLQLANQGLHRHPAHEHGVHKPLPAADRTQSRHDAIYILERAFVTVWGEL